MSQLKSKRVSYIGSDEYKYGKFAGKTKEKPKEVVELSLLADIKKTKRYIQQKNGEYTFFTSIEYATLSNLPGAFLNTTTIDVQIGRKYSFNEIGILYDQLSITQAEINDIFNEYYQFEVEDKQEVKVEKETKELTFDDILNLLYHPNFYFDDLPKKKDNMNLLVKTVLLCPESFDEIFMVEVPAPSSPLMKTYLQTLSFYVNAELKDKQEVDNIEDLQKKAYSQTDYIGKTFETVLEEAKDFGDYLRFLLNKGERLIVTSDQKEYAFTLRKLVSTYGEIRLDNIKSKSLNHEVTYSCPALNGYHLSVFVDQKISESISSYSNLANRLFLYIPDINNLDEYLEKYHYDLKIALIFSANGKNVDLFVVDENYNHGLFTIKGPTMNKWIRKLEGIIPKLNNIIMEEMTFPYNVSKTI